MGLCTTVMLLTACGSRTVTPAGQVKVGVLVSLSGAGGAIGTEQAKAMRLAVEGLNSGGGVHGAKLQLVVADTGSYPAQSAIAMRQLIVQDKVAAVLGPTLSIEAVRADPIANALQTPVLAVSNTAPGIVGRCAYACQWIWRNSLGADQTVTANVADDVRRRNPVSAAVLHTAPDVLAESEAHIAATAFRAHGVTVVADVTLPRAHSGTPAVARVVARALRGRPGVLFVSATDGAEAAETIRAARAQGFRGDILGGDALNESSAIRAAGKAGRGVRTGSAWFAGNDFPANSHFVSTFQSAFRARPDQFAAQAYSGVAILAQAIQRGGAYDGALTVAQRRAAVQRGLGTVALTTPLGPFRFTRDHDVRQVVWILQGNSRGTDDLVQFCDPTC